MANKSYIVTMTRVYKTYFTIEASSEQAAIELVENRADRYAEEQEQMNVDESYEARSISRERAELEEKRQWYISKFK